MFHTDTLSVRPITYKLDLDEQRLKNIRPFFKLHSGSYSRISKTFNKSGENVKGDDVAKINRREKGNVTIELWDGSSSRQENLIGHGELNYNSLSTNEGKYEEWVPLYDRNHKQVGKALVEVNIAPADQNLSLGDSFKSSIGDLDTSFRRAIEDMNRTFEHFGGFGLGQRSLEGEKQGAIEGGKSVDSKDKQLSTRPEDDKLWSNRRSLFTSTFDDMHNIFERTLEDMHNRFEEMTRDFFGTPEWTGRGIEGDKSKSTDLEAEKGRYGQHDTSRTDSTQDSLRDRRDVKSTGKNLDTKDQTLKNAPQS